jgi:hypothetical protein
MNRLRWLLVPLALTAVTPARADAVTWGGSSGRFRVSVTSSGFNEGAGEGGWSESGARDFAMWAARFNALLPIGSEVTMERDVNDDDTTLTMRRGARTFISHMRGGPDFDAALALVARWCGRRVPPTRPSPTLYTVQVFAGRSKINADAFAQRLEERGVTADDSFFEEACLPCSIPATRVLEARQGGLYRVILGVYDRRDAATRARVRLRRELGVAGWVTAL